MKNMKTVNTLSVLPITRKARANKAGDIPIYFRITVNGAAVEFSTKHYIKPELWDSKAGRVAGNTALAKTINSDLHNLEIRCRKHYNYLITSERQVTASMIKNLLQGNTALRSHRLAPASPRR